MTVREVLDSEPVRRGAPEVLAGHGALEGDVRWVHVSDVPRVAGLIDGGELLLTTGGFLELADPDALAELDRVVDGGAAGVVLELGSPPSPAVVARARERDFPLVVLHEQVRFVEITEQVHRRLVSAQLEQVTFAAEVHATFTMLGLRRADRGAILDAAARLLPGPVVLEDQRRRVLSSAALGGATAPLLEEWEARSRLVTWRAGTAVGGPEHWLTTTVGVQGRVWARLVAPRTGDTARAAVVLERAAQALELGRMIERDDAATELRLHGSLISDLVSGRLPDEPAALARLRAVGLRPARAYVGLVALGGPGSELVGRLRRLLGDSRVEGLVAPLDDRHVGVLLAADDPDAVLDRLRPEGLLLAAGEPVGRLTDVPGSWRSARVVAGVAGDLPPRAGVVRHADVRLHGLLASLGDSPAVSAFVEAELGRVLAHDARHGTDLLGLLRALLDAGGQVTALARATHRNRSSLYPALARLEQVVGHPLDTPASRTSLAVALLAHDLGRAR
ncbi:PucR family transcriptional regulator [Nocardioides aequoreus]|uniref:PucR family transcriptional regulator n=1 Tax=Nocardioides aequoreus TaxID=397278 RepID=UPI0004C4668A|nr:PucR family transcriptional regulator ligand-binding domain-containing protein [Nocardioides aequoreus]